MDTALSGPEGPGSGSFVTARHVLTGEVPCPSWSQVDPNPGGAAYVVLGEPGTGKTAFLKMLLNAQSAARVNRARDAADRATCLLDGLDELQAQANPAVVFYVGHGTTELTQRMDVIWSDPLLQCNLLYDQVGGPAPALPGWDPLALSAGTEPGAPWQVLPRYTDRPFVPCSSCGAGVLAPGAVAATWWRRPIDIVNGWWVPASLAPVAVTIRDQQLARDYWQGLRDLVGHVLDVLRLMIVTLLAALSHRAQVPTFLLVMIAAARRYGRRSDGDGHFRPAPYLHRYKRGAVCLAP